MHKVVVAIQWYDVILCHYDVISLINYDVMMLSFHTVKTVCVHASNTACQTGLLEEPTHPLTRTWLDVPGAALLHIGWRRMTPVVCMYV